jgi:hypothetical protein
MFTTLLDLVRGALEPRNAGIFVSYLVQNRWSENRELLVRLRDYLEQFENLDRLYAPQPIPPTGVTFAEGVSALSGAIVLVDLSTTKPGCAEVVRVWHTDRWEGRGHVPAARRRDFRSSYARLHDEHAITAPVGLGEYNSRTPILRSVEVRQHPGSDGAAVVIVTSESDYLSSEPSKDGSDNVHCKKLWPALTDPHLAQIEHAREPASSSLETGVDPQPRRRLLGARLVDKADGLARRGMLLNGKLGLISYADPAEPAIVLMQRTLVTSNAAGTLGPTAGGVVEMKVWGDARDSDGFGSVDFLSGIRRELSEELGLSPEDYNIAVRSVFAANNRTRPRALEEKDARLDTGELVATVLTLGTTPLGKAEFARRRYDGSPSKGLYESKGVLFLPLGKSAEQLARYVAHGHYDPQSCRWLGRWKRPGSCRIADELEQPTLVTILYASAMRYGPQATLRAFAAAFPEAWWSLPWPDAAVAGESRVCRPPQDLLTDTESFDSWGRLLGIRHDHAALERDVRALKRESAGQDDR